MVTKHRGQSKWILKESVMKARLQLRAHSAYLTDRKDGYSRVNNRTVSVFVGYRPHSVCSRMSSSKYPKVTKPSPTPQDSQPVAMDMHQKLVLKRKRPLIAENIGFSPEDQKKYRELGMLNDRMIGDIMIEKTEFCQCLKFLELLPQKGPEMYEALQDLLHDQGHSWIAQEMKMDLLAEQGQLEIEGYVYREAGVIVHRHFGRSKRISESDKKEIQLILAMRYQAAKDAWHDQMKKVEEELRQALEYKLGENARLRDLGEKITTYMRIQQKSINEHSHDLLHGLDTVREDSDPENTKKDYHQHLSSLIDLVLETMSRLLLEKERMSNERNRCLKVLQISKPVLQMDVVLEDALLQAAQSIVKSQKEASNSDNIAQSLDSQMKTLRVEADRELGSQQRHILFLESLNRQQEEKMRQLEMQVIEIRSKRDEMEEEANKWRKRCEMLEKTRRLGYYNPGWHDKLYNMVEYIEYGRLDDNTSPPPLVPLVPGQRTSKDGINSPRTTKNTTYGKTPKIKNTPNTKPEKDKAKEEPGKKQISYVSSSNVNSSAYY